MVSKIAITVVLVVICIIAFILAIVLGTQSSSSSNGESCGQPNSPTNLTFTPSIETLVISWTSPEEASSCTISYEIRYSIDDESESRAVMNANVYEIPKLDICSVLYVRVWSVSATGELSADFVADNYTEAPSEISATTNITFSVISEELVLSWSPIKENTICNVSYSVLLITDLGVYLDVAYTESFVISESIYCFNFIVQIAAIIGKMYGEVATELFVGEFTPPQDLVLTPSRDTNQLIASWANHTKEQQCDIMYFAMYQVEGDLAIGVPTGGHSVPFDIAHCAKATVTITAVSRLTPRYAVASETHEEGVPDKVGEVTNIVVNITNTEAHVTWNSPFSSAHCDIEYRVETNPPSEPCIGHTGCVINSNTFCPSTTFTIQAESLPGDSATYTYNC